MKCKKCGIDFDYHVFDSNEPGGKTRESIYCPECGEYNGESRMTNGYITTYVIKK
ncbi:hypothetical protein [Mycoplasma sp. OR1901]|uniref:hypothetical protein n=1 Tax=Mycoplasma sp. OR1901 TaxID=2742195 RepID=UPI001582877F|nr:hypothetical protein [Mycoplasma sp. OR1901]QKT05503.1 hypothetical protein HTZ87_02190 [Mycoplasma sp. OR1901]